MLAKFRHLENLIFIFALAGVLIGFFYTEESLMLKIFAVVLAVVALGIAFRGGKSKTVSSKYELLSLLIMYLGVFAAFNFLYTVNLPLYAAMVLIFILTILVTLSMFSLDGVKTLIAKEIYHGLIVLLGLVILEAFLALYFLSIDPVLKSLFIIVVYYFLINFVYLYMNSMLRLKKVIGFVIISLIILAAIVIDTWFSLPR